MILDEPLWFYLGIGVALLTAIGFFAQARRRRRLANFLGGPRAAERLSGTSLYRWRLDRLALVAVAALATGVAAAGPSLPEAVPEESEEDPAPRVVMAVDISASMQAIDGQTARTRLGDVTPAIRRIVADLPDAEIGLVLFAGTAYPIAPPTADHRALGFFLDGLTPTIASAWDPGSLPSQAIAEALRMLATGDTAAARFIVLFGDGEAGERADRLGEVLERAADAGVRVHVVGAGTSRGGVMSMPDGAYQVGGPVVTESGERAYSRLREETLRGWAEAGGGSYAHVTDVDGLDGIRRSLVPPPPPPAAEPDPAPFLQRVDLGALLALFALILLVAESLFEVRIPGQWHGTRRLPARPMIGSSS